MINSSCFISFFFLLHPQNLPISLFVITKDLRFFTIWRTILGTNDTFLLNNSGLLTKKFVNLLKNAEDGIIDLNNAADTLEVRIVILNSLLLNSFIEKLMPSTGAKEAYL